MPADSKSLEKKLSEGTDSSNRREFTEEELMQKFFNKKAKPSKQENTKLTLPVYYEGMKRPLVHIRARGTEKISGLENIEVDANAIILILNELVDQTWMVKLDSLKKECESVLKENPAEKENICWASVSKFEDSDVKVIFNERNLDIRIRVNPNLRSVKIASLANYDSLEDESTNEPSWFSTYVNLNLRESFQSDHVVYKDGREPYTINLDSATRFGAVLLEANGYSTEKRPEVNSVEPGFVRGNVRGVIDFQSLSSRSQIGDLSYPVKGYQVYRAMAGVSLFTQTSLKPSLLTNPSESYELNLVRPSKITVYINDRIIQVFDLPAGRHSLRDIPFTQGENNLKLEITDDFGRTEVQSYSVFLSNRLLKPSEHEISYAAGMPSTDANGVRSYDSKNTLVSIFHRYGFSQSLTLGANIQVDPYQMVSGLEFSFVNSWGYFSVEPAYSLNQDHPSGYATRFRYYVQDLFDVEKNVKSWMFEAGFLSSDFAPLGTRNPSNQTSLSLKVNHARNISKKTSVNLGFDYNFNREISSTPKADSYTISVGAGRRWDYGFNTNVNFSHTKSNAGADDIAVILVLLWSPPKERQFIGVSTESSTRITRADWTYQPTGGVGGLKSRVNFVGKPTGDGYGLNFDYIANRYTASVSHQVEIKKEDTTTVPVTPKQSVHTTYLNMGTSLAFAGGHFAISRPIYDSFAIFSPLKNIKDENVQINPQKNGTYYGETDWLGSAVASELPSYANSSIILKLKTEKLGVSLPKDHFTVNPLYRSGYAITIGTDATVYLKTQLLLADGKPAPMLAGKAIYLDDSSVEPVVVFTNRKGLVRSEGFRHGRYRLEISGEEEYEPAEFVIPDSAPDEFELPPLQLKARTK